MRTLELAIKAGDHLLMLTQKDAKVETPGQEDLYAIGTLALVESVIALPKDYYKVGVKGIARVNLRRYDDSGEVIQAEAYLLPEPSQAAAGSLQTFHQAVETFLGRNSDASRLLSLDQIRELPLGKAIDTVAGLVPAEVKQKQEILEQLEIGPRLDALLRLLELDSARSEVDRTLDEKTRQRMDQDHKQYVLNEKMRVIQQELGKKEEKDESARLRDQIEAAGMSAEAKGKALEELERLEAMPPQSAEATVSRTYLDWLLALPWKAMADERLDLDGGGAGAGRGPLRPRQDQGPHPRAPGRHGPAAEGSGQGRAGERPAPPPRPDPLPGGPPGRGQDLAGPQHRPGPEPALRAAVPGRRAG